MPQPPSARRQLRIGKALAMFGLGGLLAILILLAAMRLEHTMSTTLPPPTGPFPVGRLVSDWRDDATDSLAPIAGTKRELLVWVWYPAAPSQSAIPKQDSVEAQMRAAFERSRPRQKMLGTLMTKFFTRDPSKLRVHSLPNANVAVQQRPYPILILRGGASAGVTNYASLAEDLASHGYVIIGFDAPYRTGVVVFPDGRVVWRTDENNPELIPGRPDSTRRINRLLAAWTSDISFVLHRLTRLNESDSSGRFTGRLDMSRVGLFGHSLGGAEVVQFCHDDSRCGAVADVDGAPLGTVVGDGVRVPLMFLLSDHGDSKDAQTRKIQSDIQSIYGRLPSGARLRVVISGANHFLFSDDGALLKSHVLLGTLRVLQLVHIDGPRQLAATRYCLRSFFDAYLKGAAPARTAITSSDYPEIHVLD